jgi:hypothetical protein
MQSLHTCDNRPCVNQSHLYEGTHANNMEDMVQRKRNPGGPGGNALPALTPDECAEVRSRYFAGGITQAELGREYGVTQACISKVVNGKIRW